MSGANDTPPECCIGVGYGEFHQIGPNLTMGDEMNCASKLGEDIARGGETLVTESVRRALAARDDVTFEHVTGDDLLFPLLPRAARLAETIHRPARYSGRYSWNMCPSSSSVRGGTR